MTSSSQERFTVRIVRTTSGIVVVDDHCVEERRVARASI
jgi:hypothetical protein